MRQIDLDTTRQGELYAQACRDMAQCIPGWSDRYPSDPAVAVLEYFTYLSDIQNYSLNRIREEHYLTYVKMLGQNVRRTHPAELLAMAADGETYLPGQRFTIDDLIFEVAGERRDPMPRVVEVQFCSGEGRQLPGGTGAIKLPGGSGGALTVVLNGTLSAGRPVSLWCKVTPEPGRNPPADDTPAPVLFTAWVGGKQVPCEDDTCGLLRSGFLTFTPAAPGEEIVLEAAGQWEGRPELTAVVLEPLRLIQQQTRSTEIELEPPFRLPEGWLGSRVLFYFTPTLKGWRRQESFTEAEGCVTGWTGRAPSRIRVVAMEPEFPGEAELHGLAMERILLEEPGLWQDSLEVMVEQEGIWYDCPLCHPVEGRTLPLGCRWEAYRSSLYFGDGRDYLIPKPGRVLISGCILTRGRAANGAGGVLSGEKGVLTALTNGAGGMDRETPREAFLRSAQEQDRPCRAVTCGDYEALSRRAPGLALEQVRAMPGAALGEPGPGVVVLVKPKSEGEKNELTAWQRARLADYLEPMRMMGVPVEIRDARYCPIRVRVSLVSSEPIPREKLRRAALPFTDGLEGPLDFGAEVSYTALYAALGGVPHVRSIRRLELIPLIGGVHRTQDGSIRPMPDMLPCLTEFEVME